MIEPALIDRIALFRDLTPAARRELAARATMRTLARGELLWRAGDDAREMLVLFEGQVRVVRAAGGRQHVIHVEGPGGTLGEVPFFEGGCYPATAIASRRSRCLALGHDALEAVMREDGGLALKLLARLAARVRWLIERLDGAVAKTVQERLAGVLLDRAYGVAGPITLGATQAELAEELGTTREVLARALRRLRESGAVRSAGRGCFQVGDGEMLRRLASRGQAPDVSPRAETAAPSPERPFLIPNP